MARLLEATVEHLSDNLEIILALSAAAVLIVGALLLAML